MTSGAGSDSLAIGAQAARHGGSKRQRSNRSKRTRPHAIFCTLAGAGGEKTLARMAELCEQVPVAKLIVTERELKSGAFRAMADEFATDISEVRN